MSGGIHISQIAASIWQSRRNSISIALIFIFFSSIGLANFITIHKLKDRLDAIEPKQQCEPVNLEKE